MIQEMRQFIDALQTKMKHKGISLTSLKSNIKSSHISDKEIENIYQQATKKHLSLH